MIKLDSKDRKGVHKFAFENSFDFFARKYISVVEPETVFDWNWHLEQTCETLQAQYEGRLPRNIDYQMPPRMLKSLLINVLFPVWVWVRDPSKKIISASSNHNLALGFSLKRRDLIKSDQFQYYWPIKLKESRDTMNWFENTSNGFMRAVSAEGKIIGVGGDILLSDDLIEVLEAFSKKDRERIKNWYSSAFHGRAQNKKTVLRINVNQRVHEQDISAHLASKHKFHRVVFEMIKTSKKLSTIDIKDPRKVGEYLFPARYGPEEAAEDQTQGSYVWSSQFQQSPTPIGGGIVKEEWIRYHSGPMPSFTREIITADLNMKKGGDYACFMCWGVTADNRKIMKDAVRGRWSYKQTKEEFKTFCLRNQNAKYKYIEDKANGPALISDLPDLYILKAWPEKKELKDLNKLQRLTMCSGEFESGNVYFNSDLEITKSIVQEVTSFTEEGSTTGNDDATDTTTMALLELKGVKTFFY